LTSAKNIKTPLMIAQGANDPRVNHAESEQIIVALRDRGFPVEYLLIPDEGHGFARPVNNMASIMATEKFFAKYLGGRYQEGGTPEVVARLKEVTVDPKTVVVAKKADPSRVGVPKAAVDLRPGTYKYKAKLAMGGQEMALDSSTTIKEENGAWTATATLNTPNGQVLVTSTLEKGSLIVRNVNVTQPGGGVKVEFKDNKATGNMNLNGQDRPVAADLGGPLFADAAGSDEAIACLPLAEGYSTTFRNFDIFKQKEKLLQLKVAGAESVTVPAGTFDTFKVEITSADGGPDHQTVWIAKDSRKPVKVSQTLADMGGAILTAELVP
jgi:hypothetical protein